MTGDPAEGGCGELRPRELRTIPLWRRRLVVALGRVNRRWFEPPMPCPAAFDWPTVPDRLGAWAGPSSPLPCRLPADHPGLHRVEWSRGREAYLVEWSS